MYNSRQKCTNAQLENVASWSNRNSRSYYSMCETSERKKFFMNEIDVMRMTNFIEETQKKNVHKTFCIKYMLYMIW